MFHNKAKWPGSTRKTETMRMTSYHPGGGCFIISCSLTDRLTPFSGFVLIKNLN
jgi:hypothetical protein